MAAARRRARPAVRARPAEAAAGGGRRGGAVGLCPLQSVHRRLGDGGGAGGLRAEGRGSVVKTSWRPEVEVSRARSGACRPRQFR